MVNVKIKKALAINGVRQWQLAKALGICEFTLIRRLREELPEEEQERIIKLIEREANDGKGGD